jgi:predicted transcriptional regulator YheO
MIRYSNPPSEIVSMKSSLVNDVSFQNEPAVEKFMSRVKQRQFNLMENFDLSIGSVQQALSNSKQQRSAEPLRDISNEQQLPTRDLNLFFQRLDDGAYDKKTLIKIIAKLLDCAERTHSSYVESLVKKYNL